MPTEYEATFWPIDKDDMRERLAAAGAIMEYPERLMRRVNYYLPSEALVKRAWLRVRDEGDKITVSVKQSGVLIDDQKELQITVNDFDAAVELFTTIGATRKNYQETRRECWKMGDVEITIDEWPWLEPLLEIEGPSTEQVRAVADALNLSWDEAYFCSIDNLYGKRYNIEPRAVVEGIPHLVFEGPNTLSELTGK